MEIPTVLRDTSASPSGVSTMNIPSLLYALTILHAGYLLQLAFRQPSSKVISHKTESWAMYLAASPTGMLFARTITLLIALHHATVSLTLSLLYIGITIRLRAYTDLGTNFTFRVAAPDKLVTSGVYTHIRHPSYTGLLIVLLAYYFLLIQPRGVLSCWAGVVGEEMVGEGRYAYVLPVVGFSLFISMFMVWRVKEEEAVMEREFGEKWRRYRAGTKKFVPFVY
jgi:protein-S-isoprenylcysteine O-methyltransferase Ste14